MVPFVECPYSQGVGHMLEQFCPLHVGVGLRHIGERSVEFVVSQDGDGYMLPRLDNSFRSQSSIEGREFIPKGEGPPIDSYNRRRDGLLRVEVRGHVACIKKQVCLFDAKASADFHEGTSGPAFQQKASVAGGDLQTRVRVRMRRTRRHIAAAPWLDAIEQA
jgi:hypothetical protein